MSRFTRKTAISVLVALAFVVPAAACSSSSKSNATTVNVVTKDYSIAATPTSAPAGDVKFTVKNEGSFMHEVLVVKADSTSSLPLNADGSINEEKLGEANIPGEVADIEPGQTKSETLKLSTGKYLLICNRMDGTISHYQKGMVLPFTVS